MINVSINGINVEVEEGTTILEAAKKINIKIPTLCYLDLSELGFKSHQASCRVCVVEDEETGKLLASCAEFVRDGMKIRTDTHKVIQSRRVNIELLLSNHPTDCLVCRNNGECELQDLAVLAGIRQIRYKGERTEYPIDESSYSIIRDPNKCILCMRCVNMCSDVQHVHALAEIGKGFNTVVGTAYNMPMIDTVCTFCGQCLAVCPTGALCEVTWQREVYRALRDPEKIVLVQTAPAVRVALGESFGMPAGSIVTGKMVTALRSMGFDYVFDTDFAADLTTMEEAKEFVDRFTKKENLPILTSCCPSWVKFIEHNFGDMLNIPSTCKSPHEMFVTVAKTYFAEMKNIDPRNIIVVSVMPCVAKKYESARPELATVDGISDVDYVISTRELAHMIKEFALDFPNLPDSEFDNPLGESTGAGVIFGASGGVLESAVRTAYKMITGDDLEKLEFKDLKELKGIKEAQIDIQGETVKVAVASGLGNAKQLLTDIRDGKKHYDIIEIMACSGGCIGGAGQPLLKGNVNCVVRMKIRLLKRFTMSILVRSVRKRHIIYFIRNIMNEKWIFNLQTENFARKRWRKRAKRVIINGSHCTT